jgi:hypothetical protein
VVVFDDYRLETFVDDHTLHFIFPAEEANPRALFLSLWLFLKGKSTPKLLKPGEEFEGPLQDTLRKMGFTVLWMAGNTYIDAWVIKNSVRYHLSFERTGENKYRLVEKERVQ